MKISTRTRGWDRSAHLIEDGEVVCPVQGARVDFERCLACGRFAGIVEHVRGPGVVCDTPPGPAPGGLAVPLLP